MNQEHSPLLDGHIQDQLHAATQEIARRLTVCGHRRVAIAHHSGMDPETIRLIQLGRTATASPKTLDALVIALDRLDGEET